MSEPFSGLSTQFLAKRHNLMAFIGGLVRDPGAAEDIFQEVWVRLAEASKSETEITDLNKWCRGTARNLILHYWRDKRTATVIADSQMLQLVEQAFEEQDERQAAWNARKNALAECVKALPEKSKELLRLVYEQGVPLARVAERLKRPYAGVLMALSRVRRALAECVEKKIRLEEYSA